MSVRSCHEAPFQRRTLKLVSSVVLSLQLRLTCEPETAVPPVKSGAGGVWDEPRRSSRTG